MLSRFPSPPEDLTRAIITLDEKSFDLDSLQALKQFTPEPEEVILKHENFNSLSLKDLLL
jgi:hypothetical protein